MKEGRTQDTRLRADYAPVDCEGLLVTFDIEIGEVAGLQKSGLG